jgi:hypothetical protein
VLQAQTPTDSLAGVYAGKYWLANPSTNPWVITGDTVYVTSIDSVNCLVIASDKSNSVGYGNGNYYTNYYSYNNAAPTNYYMKFYSSDSVKWIDNNLPQPPPNPAISRRFYGKRIGPYHGIGVKQFAGNSNQISIYPNPASTMLHVELKRPNETAQIQISNALGQELINTQEKDIDVSNLPNGVYFVRVGNSMQKFVVQH